MARVSNNIITQGLSGTIGGTLVFRQVGGQTVVAAAPRESDKAPTARQQAHQERFQMAALYAKAQLADPGSKAEYEAARPEAGTASAYAIAVADFMQAPDIHSIDLSQYEGRVGDTIRVRVTDNFKVTATRVRIENADGTLVEETAAVREANGLDWVFTATVANASLVGDKITVLASDKPGNQTRETRSL
ncbi:hypothetical protein [Hymenobacter edaphi]|uniref:Uncharacterized protein n=1 Tax=Hymenobacter edaphi TaxID=2211146 RepID=A0A328BTC0_9BACT|nr:hypothetical protein [Hymenobacter edaphi]RAK70532.1 hypothetical protein DLM85_06775 [Hymenobacter edaphi]